MESYFSALVDFVSAHPHYAHITVFLLALSEAIPVVGTIVPGSTLVVAVSALATSADVNPWILLIAATTGAIAGDGFSFWLGQRYREKILNNLAAESVSAIDCSERKIHNPIRRGKRLSCALHGGGPRIRAVDIRHSPNVAATVLYREYLVGGDLGAGSCVPWCRACNGAAIVQRKRGAARHSRDRGTDRCGIGDLCHAPIHQGQVKRPGDEAK